MGHRMEQWRHLVQSLVLAPLPECITAPATRALPARRQAAPSVAAAILAAPAAFAARAGFLYDLPGAVRLVISRDRVYIMVKRRRLRRRRLGQ